MKLIPLTQGKFAQVDDDDFEMLNKWKWFTHKNKTIFYGERNIMANNKYTTVKMHRIIMKAEEGQIIDHINGNGLNNQKSNLRFCTHSQNNANRQKKSKCYSIYLGIYFRKDRQKWTSRIKHNNISYRLGELKNEIDAAKAYNIKALELHGEFARLNSV